MLHIGICASVVNLVFVSVIELQGTAKMIKEEVVCLRSLIDLHLFAVSIF